MSRETKCKEIKKIEIGDGWELGSKKISTNKTKEIERVEVCDN